MPAVKQILQRLESRKQLSGRRTLQNLYGIGYPTCKYSLAILRAPYYMVCRLVHTIAVVYDFYHVSNFITWKCKTHVPQFLT